MAALRAELETLKTSQMPGLPAGWIWQHDPGLNKLFFVETNTGHVQWEPPPAPDTAAAARAEAPTAAERSGVGTPALVAAGVLHSRGELSLRRPKPWHHASQAWAPAWMPA